MRSHLLFCLPALSVLSLMGLVSPATAAQPMLVLRQKHRLFGDVITYVTRDAVKVESINRERSFLSSAPKWEAHVMNEKRRLVYRSPFGNWSKRGLKTALSLEDNDELNDERTVSEGKIKYAGVEGESFYYRAGPRLRGKRADIIVLRSFQTHPNVQLFLHAAFELPSGTGIPLRFRRVAGDSYGMGLKYNKLTEVQTMLETTSIKTTTSKPAIFVLPTDFKSTSDGEVLMDPSAHDVYKDLMGD